MTKSTAAIPVIALYEGIHETAARAKARAGLYGALVSLAGAQRYREVDLAEYARINSEEIDQKRLEQCRVLHRIALENARLEKLHDFAEQRLEEIAVAKAKTK